MRIQVVLSLPTEAASVPLARHTVAAALGSAGVSRSCVDEVTVALSEACTNVVRHAGDEHPYDVVINIADQQLTIDVLDSGRGFGHLAAQPTTIADESAEEIAQGGRGLTLMRELTDRAIFDSVTGGGGSVHMMKILRWTTPRFGAGDGFGAAAPLQATEPDATGGDGKAGAAADRPSSQVTTTETAGGNENGTPASPADT